VCSLEAAQEQVERLQHLLSQRGGDVILELAAFAQNRRQALLGRYGKQPLGAQQHVQSAEDRTPADLAHRPYRKREMPGGLRARCVNQPDLGGVGK
jgi:hypothetical protein